MQKAPKCYWVGESADPIGFRRSFFFPVHLCQVEVEAILAYCLSRADGADFPARLGFYSDSLLGMHPGPQAFFAFFIPDRDRMDAELPFAAP